MRLRSTMRSIAGGLAAAFMANAAWAADFVILDSTAAGIEAGIVVDGEAEITIPDGAQIVVQGHDVEAVSDAAGHFRLALPVGTWTLSVVHPRYAAHVERDIVVAAGETTRRTITLRPEARCTLRILDGAGQSPPPCYLRLGFADGRWVDRRPDPARRREVRPIAVHGGKLTLGELPSGTVEIQISARAAGPWQPLGRLVLDEGDNPPSAFTWRE